MWLFITKLCCFRLGKPFGIENVVRICYACSKQELETGLTLIKEAIDKIN